MCKKELPRSFSEFTFMDPNGNKISAHGFGSNFAIKCFCGHPVLLTKNAGKEPGMSIANPAECMGAFCDAKYYVSGWDGKTTVTIAKI